VHRRDARQNEKPEETLTELAKLPLNHQKPGTQWNYGH